MLLLTITYVVCFSKCKDNYLFVIRHTAYFMLNTAYAGSLMIKIIPKSKYQNLSIHFCISDRMNKTYSEFSLYGQPFGRYSQSSQKIQTLNKSGSISLKYNLIFYVFE
jgi:hypothetical protein